MLLCFPITVRKKSNVAQETDAGMIMVNIFFAHWIRKISVKRCEDDPAILPLNNAIEIYRYSEAILKNVPKKS